MRVVGVDHSLTSTGVAFVAAPADEEPRVEWMRTINSAAPPLTADPLEARMDRINLIARRFADHMDDVADHPAGGPLILVIETRDFQTKTRLGGMPTDRAGLWVQIMCTARIYGAWLVGVAPTTLKVYGCGNGSAGKHEMQDAVERRYGVTCRNDDEADALAAAAMGADRYGRPLAELGDQYRRSLLRPRWPAIPGTVVRSV